MAYQEVESGPAHSGLCPSDHWVIVLHRWPKVQISTEGQAWPKRNWPFLD